MRTWITYAAGMVLTIAAGVLAAAHPKILAAALAAAAVLLVAARSVQTLSAFLIVAAVPFMRPMILGERYTPVSIALAALALMLALASRQRGIWDPPAKAAVGWLSLLWLWVLVLPVIHPGSDAAATLKGAAGVWFVAAAAIIVAADLQRRKLIERGLLALTLLACVSMAVTAVFWLLGGSDTGLLGMFPIGYRSTLHDAGTAVFAPFTPVSGGTTVAGMFVPRFLGLGREPGVMAALIVWAMFLVSRQGWPRWTLAVLGVGLVATQSTAGFGILLGALVLSKYMGVRDSTGRSRGAVRQLVGIAFMAGALYLAIWSPTFGVEAKRQLNAASIGDRQAGTIAGLQAILEHPLGSAPAQDEATVADGINIIAATTLIGIPGTALTLLAIGRPILLARRRDGAWPTPAVAILATGLVAQPMLQSTAFYLLVALTCVGQRRTAILPGSADLPTSVIGGPVRDCHTLPPDDRVICSEAVRDRLTDVQSHS